MSESIYKTGEYADKNPGYHVHDSPWKVQLVLELLRRNKLEPRRVADIGCGAGEVLAELSRQLPEATELHGFDVSPDACRLAGERASDRLSFSCEDLLARQLDEPFELVLCLDVFEHVPDYFGFLEALRGKADYKLFKIPLDMTAQMVARGGPIRRVREEVGHLHYFSKYTALAALKDCGYEIVDSFYAHRKWANLKSFKSRLLHLPRKMMTAVAEEFTMRTLGGSPLMVLAR